MEQSAAAERQSSASSSDQTVIRRSSRRLLYPRSHNRLGPIGRSGHGLLATDANIYLLGGYNPADPNEAAHQPRNMNDFPMIRDLWRYHITTGLWHELPQRGDVPNEAASFCAELYGGKIYLLGGTGYPFAIVGGTALHVYDLMTHEWTIQECDGDSLPDIMYGHSWIRIDDLMYIFGGTSGHEYYNDVFTLNLQTFTITQIQTECEWSVIDLPPARYKQEIATDGQFIYIFGGGTSTSVETLATVWKFDTLQLKWEKSDTLPDHKHGFPIPRKCHSCVQTDSYAIITGGDSMTAALRDIWRFSFSDSQWTRLGAFLPKALLFHTSVSIPSDGNVMYNFGGVMRLPTREIRSKRLTQITFDVRPLCELAWESLVSQGNIQPSKRKELLREGIPPHLLDRLDYESLPAAAS